MWSKPAAAALSVEVGSAARGVQEIECEGERTEIGRKEVGGGGQEEIERERETSVSSQHVSEPSRLQKDALVFC